MSLGSKIRHITESDQLIQYKKLLDHLPAAVYVCDADGYITMYNQAAARLWGRQPEIGKEQWCGSWKIYDTVGIPVSRDQCPMALVLRSGKPVSGFEIVIEQPGGQKRSVIPNIKPIFDEAGGLIGAINMLVDVTDNIRHASLQKQTDDLADSTDALKRSEELYPRLTADVEDYAIIMLSREGVIQHWNRGAERIKGYAESEVLGKNFRIFYSEEDQRSGIPDHLVNTALTTGKANYEGWRIRKDGSRFWGGTVITAMRDSTGEVIGFSKVTRDLTERREQEARIERFVEDLKIKNELLRQSEERYHRMVSEVEDYVIILLDPQGFIQNWNKGAQKIKGYSADEIVGKHFTIFYSEEDKRNGIPKRLLSEAETKGKALHEGWRLRKDGSNFWGSVVLTALHNDNGDVIGFTKVTRDLTEKKIAEEKLRITSLTLEQKNKELERINEELSSFAYISSHDLQEPLRKIQTFSDRIMETEYERLSEKGRDYFRRMQAGAARMQKLIRDILAYSRTTTADKKLELTDLNDLLGQAKVELEVMINEKQAVIDQDPLPHLKVIPFQVQQLFTNLLNNALKFSRADAIPHVVIKVANIKSTDIPRSYHTIADDYYHISFKDNGIGFEPEYSKKIFEVFQRLHGRHEYGGTGIGLAICKKIVENHNGVISAESLPGQGATFNIYLPLVE